MPSGIMYLMSVLSCLPIFPVDSDVLNDLHSRKNTEHGVLHTAIDMETVVEGKRKYIV